MAPSRPIRAARAAGAAHDLRGTACGRPPAGGGVLVALPLLLLGACRATELPESTIDVDTRSTVADWSAFTLGPNDRVHVAVYGEPEFTSPQEGIRVSPAGTLSIPLLGAVGVQGRTADEVASTLEAGLAEYLLDPSVTVSVLEYSSRRFYLLGDVEKPGPYAMDRPITALEGLSMGEGFRPGANRDEVVLIRRHGEEDVEVIVFDAETPGPDGLVQVRPDDLLFVGTGGVGVFSERVLPYLQGLGFTLSQTVSLALALNRD